MAWRTVTDQTRAAGLLFLRLGAGGMLAIGHGVPKLLRFRSQAGAFPDPLGWGSTLSYTLALGAELVCASLVVLGLATRPAALAVCFTMIVAGLIHHAPDPFTMKELALLYAITFGALALTGAGPLSMDARIGRRRREARLTSAARAMTPAERPV
jgi:putative oxidoreductase